jgi:hypothetical protein
VCSCFLRLKIKGATEKLDSHQLFFPDYSMIHPSIPLITKLNWCDSPLTGLIWKHSEQWASKWEEEASEQTVSETLWDDSPF